MAHLHAATDDDTLDSLGQKLKAIAKVNEENLEIIEARRKGVVICGFSYSLKCDLPFKKNNDNADPWNVKATAKTLSIEERIGDWRYDGEQLENPKYVIDNSVNYTLENISDVHRLNKDILMLGTKCVNFLADKPETCSGMRTLLSNMEKLQVSIGELHELTIDHADTVCAKGGISSEVQSIVDDFKCLMKKLPNAKLSLTAEHYEGADETSDVAEAVLVKGSGIPEVNGTYILSGLYDEVGEYTKEGIWKEMNVLFTIYRLNDWYISIKSKENPYTNEDSDFYLAACTGSKEEAPPAKGWERAKEGSGLDPAPICIWMPCIHYNKNEGGS